MAKVKTELSYQAMNAQLEIVLARLQEPDIQVDEAVQLYEQGLALAAALEKHIQQAENTITTLKRRADESTK